MEEENPSPFDPTTTAFEEDVASNIDLATYNVINGTDDDETINGTALADYIDGGAGNNTINGLGGDDILVAGFGIDNFDGGDGNDILSFIHSLTGIVVDFETGEVSGDVLEGGFYNSVESLIGSDLDDRFGGDFDPNTFIGGAGNDILDGRDNDDRLYGEAGNDILIGGAGADIIDGGSGFDTLDFRGATNQIRMSLDLGGTFGEAEGDTYANIERVYGTIFHDDIAGDESNNILLGIGGDDTLNGNGGHDRLFGQSGNDVFVFHQGSDIDVVADFTDGEDLIDVIDFNITLAYVIDQAYQLGNHTVIDMGEGNILRLLNFDVADLDQSDFLLPIA